MYTATTTTLLLRSALSTAAGKPLRVPVAALGRTGFVGDGVGLADGVVGTSGSGAVDASLEPPKRFSMANPRAPTTPSTAKIWTGRETVTVVLSALGE
jgi:hypothetical protein